MGASRRATKSSEHTSVETMPERYERFPNGWQAFCLLLLLFVFETLLFGAVHDGQGALALTPMQSAAVVSVLGNGFLLAFVMYVKALTFRGLFHPSPASTRATTALVVPAVLMLVPSLVLLMSELEAQIVNAVPMSLYEAAMFESMRTDDLAVIMLACIIAPIVEEMLFRGVILRSFLRQYGRIPSVLGSAALFGIAHLNIYQGVEALIAGAILGWLYERTRSLIPCIALHAAYNAGSLAWGWTQRQGQATFAVWSGSLLLGALGTTLLVRMLRAPSSSQGARL